MPNFFLNSGLRYLWIALSIILLDQLSKYWVSQHLMLFEPLEILPFLNFTLAYNKGAAFSFLNAATGWQHLFLGSLAIIVSGIILAWLKHLPRHATWANVALSLILGGAIGNFWDRIRLGYVIDFLSFHWNDWYFAIFNIADSAICVGTFMLLIYWLRAPQKVSE